MPAADHPIWKLLRLIVVCITLILFCTFAYQNGFSKTDILTIVGTLLTLAGFDQAKALITKPSSSSQE